MFAHAYSLICRCVHVFICMLNFCGRSRPRNYFNSKIFPIYGRYTSYIVLMGLFTVVYCNGDVMVMSWLSVCPAAKGGTQKKPAKAPSQQQPLPTHATPMQVASNSGRSRTKTHTTLLRVMCITYNICPLSSTCIVPETIETCNPSLTHCMQK